MSVLLGDTKFDFFFATIFISGKIIHRYRNTIERLVVRVYYFLIFCLLMLSEEYHVCLHVINRYFWHHKKQDERI